MQAMVTNKGVEGEPAERGGTGGETSNFRGGDSGYVQIFGVWARGEESEEQNWEDIMIVINADLRDNHACTMASLATQHAGSQQGSSAGGSQMGCGQSGGGQMEGGQIGGGGEQSPGPKRTAPSRHNPAKKQRLTEATF